MPKNPTKWTRNPLSTANNRVYDSTVIYDTTITYDGDVAGQSRITTKQPALWASTGKTPTSWVSNSNIGTVDIYDNPSDSFDGSGTTSAFDSYDDQLSGQSTLGTKIATVWSNT